MDHRHSIHRFQLSSGVANVNGFVVNNYRRRRYLMPMPTHDAALKFLVVNIDAEADFPFAVMADSPFRLRYEPALVLVVCQRCRVDLVMSSTETERGKGEEHRHINICADQLSGKSAFRRSAYPCITSNVPNETLRARSFVDPLSSFR